MRISSIPKRISRLWLSLLHRPIRVFCFHQVSDVFEPDTMWECDWTQTEKFKQRILALKKDYTFISLPEVTAHLNIDLFRRKKYAALTSDDGWASLKNIIPWLAEQKIPVTLFLNPSYLDGIHHQERETDKLLTKEEVEQFVKDYYPFITIASHGWAHKSCEKMPFDVFVDETQKAEAYLSEMKGKVPYFAFPYGVSTSDCVAYLKSLSLVPVMINDRMNYSDASCIQRELLDGR